MCLYYFLRAGQSRHELEGAARLEVIIVDCRILSDYATYEIVDKFGKGKLYSARIPVKIQHKSAQSATYYEHKDVSYHHLLKFVLNVLMCIGR